MKKLGMFMGKSIEDMTRGELLIFAEWAIGKISELESIEEGTRDYRIKEETMKSLALK